MSFLTLNNLQKTFPDGTKAVRGIDLTIHKGEFIVLLGPSGCGKTTTLRMVAGLETPTGGTIHLADENITALRPSKRNVGFVFQFYALYPHMTVRENIAFPLQNTGTPLQEQAAQIAQTAAQLGITSLLDKRPAHLSGGDQQRIALARAMIRRPALYLMDEPLGTLDANHRVELREFIRTRQLEMAVTTLYVTHDQEEAMALADRIVVMNSGQILQIAPPSEVYTHPANLFVANFVGSPGMNLIEGQIQKEKNRHYFSSGRVTLTLNGNPKPGPAVLGIRPESIQPVPGGGIPATVSLNEYLGDHRLIHLETHLGNLIMRTSTTTLHPPGTHLQIQLNPNHIRLFDPNSTRNLQ